MRRNVYFIKCVIIFAWYLSASPACFWKWLTAEFRTKQINKNFYSLMSSADEQTSSIIILI